jgi:hypothetical protein
MWKFIGSWFMGSAAVGIFMVGVGSIAAKLVSSEPDTVRVMPPGRSRLLARRLREN